MESNRLQSTYKFYQCCALYKENFHQNVVKSHKSMIFSLFFESDAELSAIYFKLVYHQHEYILLFPVPQ